MKIDRGEIQFRIHFMYREMRERVKVYDGFLEVSKRSIKRNMKDYFLYFISLVGSIIIYFTFVSIKRNESVVALLKESDKVETTFTFAQILLIIFLTIFIFIVIVSFAKEEKEIALYSLLGIRKEEIAKLLFMKRY